MEAYRSCHDPEATSRFLEAQSEYEKALLKEDIYWRQRAKMHWFRDGDRNTRFFHQSAMARRKFKQINFLRHEDGTAVTEQQDLSMVAKRYFETLFTATSRNDEEVLSLFPQVITEDENVKLIRPISQEELYESLCDMHPNKSPGPDGFNPAFYKKIWELCGRDIWLAATNWLSRGYFPPTMNDTNICLIPRPKCNNPQNMKDYRPISLCNVVYKLV
ncbi:uncharacterized protein LOC131650452 [Vicia villosa]|uniref:uncharacterized protein LOC131650452 n=1 Tax=Vicia villosa TaxID=3911 RepID=UPI00273B2917|nr:uncharacterized protein LOC131650452 [Vicia villosa]